MRREVWFLLYDVSMGAGVWSSLSFWKIQGMNAFVLGKSCFEDVCMDLSLCGNRMSLRKVLRWTVLCMPRMGFCATTVCIDIIG